MYRAVDLKNSCQPGDNHGGYGQVIAHIALPDSTPDNGHWIRRKRNTVLRCAHGSLYMGQVTREQDISVADVFAMDRSEHAFHGGSIPIFLKGNGLIGAFTVSGLEQVEDHKFAARMLGMHSQNT